MDISKLSAPRLGLLAFFVILSWRPMAHTLAILMHDNLHGYVRGIVSLCVGALGVVVMWRGFKKDEVTASMMGILAGSLIWTGWAEEGFNGFAALLGVQALQWNGFDLLTPGLLMIEASGVMMLMMLFLLGSNKDTQCRMFLWFHRTFHIWPAKRTPGYKRQFSRITTMEYLFVVWFFYVFNIVIFDPRLLGPEHPVTAGLLLVILIWGCWLAWKLLQIRRPGLAIRYAIPTVGCWWVLVETSTAMQLFPEVWLRPMEFPIIMTMMGIVCASIWWGYSRQADPAAVEE